MTTRNTKTVAITRSSEDAKEFIDEAQRNDIKTYTLPTIQLVSKGQQIVDDFLKSLEGNKPEYSVFMSSKAVRLLFDTAKEISKIDQLRLAVANTTVVAVGPKTALALEEQKIRVNHMPTKTYSSVGIGEVFTMLNAVGKKVIIPRSGASTPFLKELLSKIGLDVQELYLYDVCAFQDTTEWNEFRQAFSQNNVDGIIFTSASSVRGFFEIISRDYDNDIHTRLQNMTLVAIGPFTADELKKMGIQNIVSQTHTVLGALNTIKEVFAKQS